MSQTVIPFTPETHAAAVAAVDCPTCQAPAGEACGVSGIHLRRWNAYVEVERDILAEEMQR